MSLQTSTSPPKSPSRSLNPGLRPASRPVSPSTLSSRSKTSSISPTDVSGSPLLPFQRRRSSSGHNRYAEHHPNVLLHEAGYTRASNKGERITGPGREEDDEEQGEEKTPTLQSQSQSTRSSSRNLQNRVLSSVKSSSFGPSKPQASSKSSARPQSVNKRSQSPLETNKSKKKGVETWTGEAPYISESKAPGGHKVGRPTFLGEIEPLRTPYSSPDTMEQGRGRTRQRALQDNEKSQVTVPSRSRDRISRREELKQGDTMSKLGKEQDRFENVSKIGLEDLESKPLNTPPILPEAQPAVVGSSWLKASPLVENQVKAIFQSFWGRQHGSTDVSSLNGRPRESSNGNFSESSIQQSTSYNWPKGVLGTLMQKPGWTVKPDLTEYEQEQDLVDSNETIKPQPQIAPRSHVPVLTNPYSRLTCFLCLCFIGLFTYLFLNYSLTGFAPHRATQTNFPHNLLHNKLGYWLSIDGKQKLTKSANTLFGGYETGTSSRAPRDAVDMRARSGRMWPLKVLLPHSSGDPNKFLLLRLYLDDLFPS